VEGDDFVRKEKFTGWGANLMLGKELNNSILGIVGMGRIGLATAQRALGFGMTVFYYDTTRKKYLEKEHGFQYMPFPDLVQLADIISLHIPSSAETYHLFNQEVFDLMKKDAIFINASRGDLLDETYLAEKLEKNQLFGAGLDVYEYEPNVTGKLKKLKNVVLAPHLGSATYKARMGMAQMTIDNVKQVFAGIRPQNLVEEYKK
jgi:glyoxylate reductase